jgi:hypothetical protein
MGGTITPFPGTTAAHQPCSPILETPCEHRQVTAGGRVVCRKAPKSDAEVSPALCASCPATLVGCEHLRFTLRKHAPVPIVVRYAGGRTEVWDDVPPAMRFERAACALRREPIGGPADCAGCALRVAVPVAMAMEEQHQSVAARGA